MTTPGGASEPNRNDSRFGVNYVPSKDWWWVWKNWSPDQVAEDLAAIRSLGLDHVRIQCLWPVLQPVRGQVCGQALDDLDQLYTLAKEAGLDVVPTVLDGWLSGFDLRPEWLGDRNIFRDQMVFAEQVRVLQAVAQRAQHHPNVIAIDIGNEINALAHETNLNPVPPGGIDEWAASLVEQVRPAAGSIPLLVGVDNRPLTHRESSMSVTAAATVGDISSVHAWPFFSGALERFGEDTPGGYAIADYFVQLFRAHQRDPHRPVWVQEFGVSPDWISPDRFEGFVRDLVRATLTIDGIWGATWWASHDIDRRHRGFADLEYGLGLLDTHNRVKLTGEILADEVARVRRGEVSAQPRTIELSVATHPTGLDDAEAFFAAYARGERPRLVLDNTTQDSEPHATVQPRSQPVTSPEVTIHQYEGVHP